jgi:deferrochelatase/peroxidase EfeB
MYFHLEDRMKSIRRKLQTGIYYGKDDLTTRSELLAGRQKPARNNTFAILFLRVLEGFKPNQVGKSLRRLWKMYEALENGMLVELPNHPVPTGELSVLIGYGPTIFKLPNIRKKMPNDFKDRQFLPPTKEGGGPILNGSGIKYAHDIYENPIANAHIVVQFISKSQLPAYRAVVETWRHLQHRDIANEPLRIMSFYTGFQRDDGRSWLGFHDELSNMNDGKEREGAIAINEINNNLRLNDFWTKYGTYLAFLRIEIDLDIWQKIEPKVQELIVGRDKLTGCPLIGVDKEGNPIIKEECQTNVGINVTDDPKFIDHPNFFIKPNVSDKVKEKLDIDATFKILNHSHIGRTRHIDGISSNESTSRRIFRQSFEFLESLNNPTKPFRAGLNFVSFQNDPGRLFFILTDPNWLGNTNFGGDPIDKYEMNNLLSVLAAGVFFVPAVEKPFPGASILM